jgi:hypothetical protein
MQWAGVQFIGSGVARRYGLELSVGSIVELSEGGIAAAPVFC